MRKILYSALVMFAVVGCATDAEPPPAQADDANSEDERGCDQILDGLDGCTTDTCRASIGEAYADCLQMVANNDGSNNSSDDNGSNNNSHDNSTPECVADQMCDTGCADDPDCEVDNLESALPALFDVTTLTLLEPNAPILRDVIQMALNSGQTILLIELLYIDETFNVRFGQGIVRGGVLDFEMFEQGVMMKDDESFRPRSPLEPVVIDIGLVGQTLTVELDLIEIEGSYDRGEIAGTLTGFITQSAATSATIPAGVGGGTLADILMPFPQTDLDGDGVSDGWNFTFTYEAERVDP